MGKDWGGDKSNTKVHHASASHAVENQGFSTYQYTILTIQRSRHYIRYQVSVGLRQGHTWLTSTIARTRA